MVCLKLNVEVGAAALASAIRIYPEKDLTELDWLSVLHIDLADDAGYLGFDLVHDLHRLDDADSLSRRHPVAHLDVRLGAWLGSLVKGSDHRGTNLLEVCSQGQRANSRVSAGLIACGRLCRGRDGHLLEHGCNRGGGGSGNNDSGPKPALHLDRPDLRRFSQQLRQALDVLEVDRANPRDVLEQLGELLHLLRAHTRVRYLSSRRSTRITWPSSMKSGTCTVAPVSRVAGLVPPVAVSPRMPGAVRVTVSSTKEGSSTVMTRSLWTRPSHSIPSFRYFS